MEKVNKYLGVILPITIFLIDRLSKYYFVSIDKYILNSGITLGLFQGQNTSALLLTSMIIFMIVLVTIRYWKTYHIRNTLVLIIVAGCSNIIDRVYYGGVVDFIGILNFPSFNIADATITISVLLLVYYFLNSEEKNVQG